MSEGNLISFHICSEMFEPSHLWEPRTIFWKAKIGWLENFLACASLLISKLFLHLLCLNLKTRNRFKVHLKGSLGRKSITFSSEVCSHPSYAVLRKLWQTAKKDPGNDCGRNILHQNTIVDLVIFVFLVRQVISISNVCRQISAL
jgi:hypothetical protein